MGTRVLMMTALVNFHLGTSYSMVESGSDDGEDESGSLFDFVQSDLDGFVRRPSYVAPTTEMEGSTKSPGRRVRVRGSNVPIWIAMEHLTILNRTTREDGLPSHGKRKFCREEEEDEDEEEDDADERCSGRVKKRRCGDSALTSLLVEWCDRSREEARVGEDSLTGLCWDECDDRLLSSVLSLSG
jgi:hypothetical protein